MSYQWRKNEANIAGATKASYTTPPAVATDDGALFSVVVSNGAGSVTSRNAVLTIKFPPTITKQPVDTAVKAGKTARFTVTASGDTPLSYQWRKNRTDVSGATKSSYTTPPTTKSDSGSIYSVVVSNSIGNATSADAVLTVN